MEELTERQKEIIQHALGLNRSDEPYRNKFVAGPGSSRWDDLIALELRGYVKRMSAGIELLSGNVFFWITESGAKAIGSTLPED